MRIFESLTKLFSLTEDDSQNVKVKVVADPQFQTVRVTAGGGTISLRNDELESTAEMLIAAAQWNREQAGGL
jgi:hypothetical protein